MKTNGVRGGTRCHALHTYAQPKIWHPVRGQPARRWTLRDCWPGWRRLLPTLLLPLGGIDHILSLPAHRGNRHGGSQDDAERRVGGRRTIPENLGRAINTGSPESDPFVAPDESEAL